MFGVFGYHFRPITLNMAQTTKTKKSTNLKWITWSVIQKIHFECIKYVCQGLTQTIIHAFIIQHTLYSLILLLVRFILLKRKYMIHSEIFHFKTQNYNQCIFNPTIAILHDLLMVTNLLLKRKYLIYYESFFILKQQSSQYSLFIEAPTHPIQNTKCNLIIYTKQVWYNFL